MPDNEREVIQTFSKYWSRWGPRVDNKTWVAPLSLFFFFFFFLPFSSLSLSSLSSFLSLSSLLLCYTGGAPEGREGSWRWGGWARRGDGSACASHGARPGGGPTGTRPGRQSRGTAGGSASSASSAGTARAVAHGRAGRDSAARLGDWERRRRLSSVPPGGGRAGRGRGRWRGAARRRPSRGHRPGQPRPRRPLTCSHLPRRPLVAPHRIQCRPAPAPRPSSPRAPLPLRSPRPLT